MAQKVKLSTIADSLGLSTATVSLALRDSPLVAEVTIFDVYAGKQVGEGKKNLAFALAYRSPEKTLADADVAEAHQKIVAEVGARFGGSLRT